MQPLDIISVNIWSFIIALANLLILFFMFKKLLFQPVKKILAQRQAEIEKDYNEAEEAKLLAQEDKAQWEQKLKDAHSEADRIIKSAAERGEARGEKIVAEAKEKADGIVRRAENEAELEMKKATEGIKQQIVEVSTKLTEKMLGREIKADDHKQLIDSFIDDIGEEQ